MILQLLFWVSLALVAYTFAGYALHVGILNRLFPRKHEPKTPSSDQPPRLSMVLVVRNEEKRIGQRIRNLAECSYDGARELIVVADGCEDSTVEKARSVDCDMPVKLVVREHAEGKASGLNAGVAAASGEILIFTDARQRFDSRALEHLVAPMRIDEKVAAVSGSLEIEPSREGAAAGMDAYWRLEKWIRNEEARWDSVIGCTGAIYAIRKSSFHPIPPDTLIDDVVIPMQALVDGGRILFEPKAVAYDPQTLETRHENRRKTRTLAGNYQNLFRYPGWLLPWKNRCWWNLIAHKYLRLGGALFLFISLASSAILAVNSMFYFAVAALQVGCYICAVLGLLFPNLRHPLVTIPSGFLFLQWQGARAFGYYLARLRSDESGAWSSGTKSEES